MAAEVTTVRRVYLKAPQFRQSAWHTAWYVTPETMGRPMHERVMQSLEFYFGVAREVPQNVYDQLAAQGIATKERPRRRDEDDD